VGGCLQTDPQERAKTSTASSGCRPLEPRPRLQTSRTAAPSSRRGKLNFPTVTDSWNKNGPGAVTTVTVSIYGDSIFRCFLCAADRRTECSGRVRGRSRDKKLRGQWVRASLCWSLAFHMSALDYFAEDKDASTSFPNPSRPPSVRSPPLSSHPDPLQAWAERDAARRLTQGAQPHLAPSVQEQGARRATPSVHQPGKASPGMQPNRGPVLPLSPPAHPIAPEVLFQAPPSPNVHVPVWRQVERAAHGRGFAASTRSAAPLRQQQPPGDAKRQLDTAGAEEVTARATRRMLVRKTDSAVCVCACGGMYVYVHAFVIF